MSIPSQSHFDANPMGTYVAELQLHLTLQARNLLPNVTQGTRASNPCHQLLHDAQVAQEIAFSRLK